MKKIIALGLVYLIVMVGFSSVGFGADYNKIKDGDYRIVMEKYPKLVHPYEGFYKEELEVKTVVSDLNKGEDLSFFSSIVKLIKRRQGEHKKSWLIYSRNEKEKDQLSVMNLMEEIRNFLHNNNDISIEGLKHLSSYVSDLIGIFKSASKGEFEKDYVNGMELTVKYIDGRINDFKLTPQEMKQASKSSTGTQITPTTSSDSSTPSIGTPTTPEKPVIDKPVVTGEKTSVTVLKEEDVLNEISKTFVVRKLNFWNEAEGVRERYALQKGEDIYRIVVGSDTVALYKVVKNSNGYYVWDEETVLRPSEKLTKIEDVVKYIESQGFNKKESEGTESTDGKFNVEFVGQYGNYIPGFGGSVGLTFSVKSENNLEVRDFSLVGLDNDCDDQSTDGSHWKCELIPRSNKQDYDVDYVVSYREDGVIKKSEGEVKFNLRIDTNNVGGINDLRNFFSTGRGVNYYGGRVESSITDNIDRILDIIEPVYKFLYTSCTIWRLLMLIKGGDSMEWMWETLPTPIKDEVGKATGEFEENTGELSSKGKMFKQFCEPIECNHCSFSKGFWNAGLIKNLFQCDPPCLTGARGSLLKLKSDLEFGYNACKARTRYSGFSLFECELELSSAICDNIYGVNVPYGGNVLGEFSRFGGMDPMALSSMMMGGLFSGGGIKQNFGVSDVEDDKEISEFCQKVSTMKFASPIINNIGSSYGSRGGYGNYGGYDSRSGYGGGYGGIVRSAFGAFARRSNLDNGYRYDYEYHVQSVQGEKVEFEVYLGNKKVGQDVVMDGNIKTEPNGKEESTEEYREICVQAKIYDSYTNTMKKFDNKCESVR